MPVTLNEDTTCLKRSERPQITQISQIELFIRAADARPLKVQREPDKILHLALVVSL